MAEQNYSGLGERRRLYDHISFITVDADCGPAELKGLNFFDVPAESFDAGCLTGIRACCEMAAVPDSFGHLTSVLRAALQQMEGDEPLSGYGAAVGLIGTFEEMLRQAALELDLGGMFRSHLSYYEGELSSQLDKLRQDNAALLNALVQGRKPAGRRRLCRKAQKGG